MAKQYGICGSLKAVRNAVKAELPHMQCLRDLDEAVSSLECEEPQWPARAASEVQEYMLELRSRLAAAEAAFAGAAPRLEQRYLPEVDRCERTIDQLESAKFLPLRWYNRLARIPKVERRLMWLRREWQAALQFHHATIDARRTALTRLQDNPASEIDCRLKWYRAKLERLRSIRESYEYAGALAECRVASVLTRGLSSAFHVFNDVNVKTESWVFDGRNNHRRSAQLDHVVVGATGVYVVETKRWSRSFAQGSQYYDPYEQVRWAGKLCHLVLTDECGQKIRVREVIASEGQLPPKPTSSFAKVVKPDQLCGYINYFGNELTPRMQDRIIAYLGRRC